MLITLVLQQQGKVLEWIFLLIISEKSNKVLIENENNVTGFNVAREID